MYPPPGVSNWSDRVKSGDAYHCYGVHTIVPSDCSFLYNISCKTRRQHIKSSTYDSSFNRDYNSYDEDGAQMWNRGDDGPFYNFSGWQGLGEDPNSSIDDVLGGVEPTMAEVIAMNLPRP
jgi:hypothetical protein